MLPVQLVPIIEAIVLEIFEKYTASILVDLHPVIPRRSKAIPMVIPMGVL